MLAAYIRQRCRDLIAAGVCGSAFLTVIFLYNQLLEPVVYAALLGGCVGLIYMGFDFWRFVRRYQLLAQLQNSIAISADDLPPAADPVEEQYQALVRTLVQDKLKLETEASKAQEELHEYYTLWAHQVKTPISAIRLLLQSGQKDNTAALELELFKIERYVEMVLQYLRVESPSGDFVIKRVSLDEVVRQAVRKYARLFIEKRIVLEYKGVDEEVLTDSKWLGFVMEQLLANALKYTQKGKISIYMDPERPHTLVIEDTGIGIAPEEIPRIFEKGYTGYNGRWERNSTGIGLYLCQRILRKLSHTITIESTVGRGTKVKIGLETDNLTIM